MFGLVTLSIAIGALQMFLDRGELVDWFDSWEIRIEAAITLVSLAFFIAHTATVQGTSFLNRDLVKDRNFVTGSLFGFVVGMVLYGTMALLPTFLQNLMNYPVTYTGMVTAPRGVGTMLAMIAVGKLVQRVDLRVIMATGFALTALALWQMTHITLDMDSRLIITSGFIQGVGIGFTFVPLSAATFATLAPRLRNEGTPIYSLVRNIGGSVGISIVQTLLTRGAAQAHEQLAGLVTRGNLGLQALPPGMGPDTPTGLALLNAEVTRQAALVAYVNDFWIMMAVTVATIPLLILIRKSRASAAPASADAAH
jgi:DHA2 family multidrug resistance protein